MKIVPQAFYGDQNIRLLLRDGLSCILQKSVRKAGLQNKRYVSTHALTFVQKGSMQITTYEGQQFHVGANNMVLIPRGLYMITDLIPEGCPFEAMVFFFEEALIEDLAASFKPKSLLYERTSALQVLRPQKVFGAIQAP